MNPFFAHYFSCNKHGLVQVPPDTDEYPKCKAESQPKSLMDALREDELAMEIERLGEHLYGKDRLPPNPGELTEAAEYAGMSVEQWRRL